MHIATIRHPRHPIHWTLRDVSLGPLIPEQVFTIDFGSAPAEGKFKFICPYYGFIQHVFSPPRSCSARILNFMDTGFVSGWNPGIDNQCIKANGRSINRTVGDLNGHPRKIINTKITVRMVIARRCAETRHAVAKTDSARFRHRGEDVRNRSRFPVLRRRRLRWLSVDSAFVPILVLNLNNC